MNRFKQATSALIAAVLLGLSGPAGATPFGDPHGDPEPAPPSGDAKFVFLGGSTVSGTATYGGVTVTFNVTINSCNGSGSSCRKGPTGYEPV